MNILFLLIPLAVVMVTIFVALLFWATRNGQFDDLDSPAMRPVLDDDRAPRRPVREPRCASSVVDVTTDG